MNYFNASLGDNITIFFDFNYNTSAANSSTPDVSPL